jgi:hypothetical protein
LLCTLAATVALLALLPAQALAVEKWRMNNGTVELGVNQQANLNVYDIDKDNQPPEPCAPGDPCPNDYAGLRFLQDGLPGVGNDATATKACEGWGVAEANTGSSGYANFCDDPPSGAPPYSPVNVNVQSFITTPTTAVSTVLVRSGDGSAGASPLLQVTHDFHPILDTTPNLYEVTVTVKNVSDHTIKPLYRRVVDWNIEPDTFAEGLFMSSFSQYLTRMSNDGYASANPLCLAPQPPDPEPDPCPSRPYADPVGNCGSPPGPCVEPYREIDVAGSISAVDPPSDQGTLFDFSLPTLIVGADVKFHLYLGAASSKANADSAVSAVHADSYALATPQANPSEGTPNTFIMAFRTRDATVTNPPPPPPPPPAPTTTTRTATPRTVVKRTPVVRPKPLRFEVLKRKYRHKAIEISLRCSTDCDVSAKGVLRMLGSSKDFKLRKYKKKLRAGVTTKLKLRLTKSSKRALRRRHAKRADLFARLSLRAVDGSGKSVKRKPAFKL